MIKCRQGRGGEFRRRNSQKEDIIARGRPSSQDVLTLDQEGGKKRNAASRKKEESKFPSVNVGRRIKEAFLPLRRIIPAEGERGGWGRVGVGKA